MQRKYLMRGRVHRLIAILLAVVVYLVLLIFNIRYSFQNHTKDFWLSFGFSALASLMFLATGSLVWLYVRSRRVALLLFCYSLAMMITFAVETGAVYNVFFEAVGGASSAIAVPLLSVLLLNFPRNRLALPKSGGALKSQYSLSHSFIQLIQGYFWLLVVVSVVVGLYSIILLFFTQKIPQILLDINSIYYIVGLSGILVIILFSYYQFSSIRERQQRRFFVSGVILTVAPVLLLTVLPQALNLPSVQSDISTVTMILFPLALAYSILRYQLLVFDTYVRRAVTYSVGAIGLLVLVYFAVAICDIFFAGRVTIYVICVVGIVAVLAPVVWWLARIVTERLFFSEILHYRRLIDEPTIFEDEIVDLEDAARLITSAALHTFEIAHVCLFVLDEGSDCYRLMPPRTNDAQETIRHALADELLRILKPTAQHADDYLEVQLPALRRLAASRRPLLLSEAIRSEAEQPTGLSRYLLTASSSEHENWMLAPVRAQGNMIGVLVLGERADKQPYAGPDFEVAQLLLARFSSILETARLYARANQHAALLNSLYTVNAMPGYPFKKIEDVATSYAVVAAGATVAGAEIWLFDQPKNELRRVCAAGMAPRIASEERLRLLRDDDWSSWFYTPERAHFTDGSSSQMPACLSCLHEAPAFPFAWLPLQKDGSRLGVFVLTFPRPHLFLRAEMRVLGMFAGHCAATLENVRMANELLLAYERQKELDVLKDQFIMTASHELRTPLTALQGYIELLGEHDVALSAEMRASFIEKARLGSDELALMVNNIMDASRVHIDIEKMSPRPIPLRKAVTYVLEIMQGLVEREKRVISVDIADHLLVIADRMRLRQVLLNLISNAFKYSPEGSPIEINAVQDEQQVRLSVRDYGLGVPERDQPLLFERFVRLERDLNSPVRGAGLGLYISKQLVEAMGGRIWLESSGVPGEGSLFIFVLQLAAQEQEQPITPVQLPV